MHMQRVLLPRGLLWLRELLLLLHALKLLQQVSRGRTASGRLLLLLLLLLQRLRLRQHGCCNRRPVVYTGGPHQPASSRTSGGRHSGK
jgi:hypothetical protein